MLAVVTGMVMVHDPTGVGGVALAGIVPPDKLNEDVPGAAVRMPPHVVDAAGEAAITRFEFNVSATDALT